jgi:hypothetical protein
VIDSILQAQRLPALAERAMREAIVGLRERAARGRAPTPRVLITDALIRFERLAQHIGGGSVRPSLLFAQRDGIARTLRTFSASELARRLYAVPKSDIVELGRQAAPFDAVVKGRGGRLYGLAFCGLASDGRRLESLRGLRQSARRHRAGPLEGVVVYDFASGSVRTLRCRTRTGMAA